MELKFNATVQFTDNSWAKFENVTPSRIIEILFFHSKTKAGKFPRFMNCYDAKDRGFVTRYWFQSGADQRTNDFKKLAWGSGDPIRAKQQILDKLETYLNTFIY